MIFLDEAGHSDDTDTGESRGDNDSAGSLQNFIVNDAADDNVDEEATRRDATKARRYPPSSVQ